MAKSLLALAQEAEELKDRGAAQAELFLESTELSKEQMAGIQQLAEVSTEAAQSLQELEEARWAVFADPMPRHAYWTKQIAMLAEDPKPDPEKVVQCLYAGQATWMPKRNRAEESRRAIPIFCLWENRAEAMRYCANVRGGPIPLPRVYRKDWNTSSARIGSYGTGFLAPWTVTDAQAFQDIKGTLCRSAEHLTDQLDQGKKMSLRAAVWLALNLTPFGLLLSKKWFERECGGEGNVVTYRRHGEHFHVEVSHSEHFIAPKNEHNERLFKQLVALAES